MKDFALKIVKSRKVQVAALALAAAVAASLGFDVDLTKILPLFGG